jgi:hypothetical protein
VKTGGCDLLQEEIACSRQQQKNRKEETGSGRRLPAAGDCLEQRGAWSKSAGGEKQKGGVEDFLE